MKYFAILKDSFREALDSKVLYVMLVLSTLVIGLVAMISFKPVSAQQTMELFFPSQDVKELRGISLMYLALYNQELRELNESPLDRPKKENDDDGENIMARLSLLNSYRLEKVEVMNDGEPDSPHSNYVLTVADSLPPFFEKDLDDAAAKKKRTDRVRKIFERADEFGLIKIGEITIDPVQDKGDRRRYKVPIHSTPQTIRMWGHKTFVLAWEMPTPAAPLGYQIYILSRVVILFGSWIGINVGVIVTSFFIPNMLTKGTIDLLLSKPIHRWTLIVYKYIGGLTFVLVNGLYAIGGLWLVIGLRTGVWPTGCLLLILTMTFFFAILYAISTYVAVVTRSTIASIMLTLVVWFAFFGVGWGHGKIHDVDLAEKILEKQGNPLAPNERWGDGWTAGTVNFFHAVTPRTEDLNQLNDRIVYCDLVSGSPANMTKLNVSRQAWPESLLAAALWIVVFLGIACFWFSYKDY